jgi:diguanylate cyclase (GGDEF)-like protein
MRGAPYLSTSRSESLNFHSLGISQAQRVTATRVAAAMLVLAVSAASFGRAPGHVNPSVLATLMGAVIVTEVLSACLLFNQFVESRRTWLLLVGSGYLFSGLCVAGYLLTFPRVFSPAGYFGANEETALSLWCAWHAAFPLAIIAALILKRSNTATRSARDATRQLLLAIASSVILVTILVYLLSRYSGSLPTLLGPVTFTPLMVGGLLPALCAFDVVALVMLVRRKLDTALDLWLPVAVLASMLDAVMGVISARYSIVWYVGKCFAVTSSSIMLAVFLAETVRVSRALARANGQLRALSEHIAKHDRITDLPNRFHLEDRLRTQLAEDRDRGGQTAVLQVNLDRLGTLNAAIGLAAGDELLREVARRLSASIRREDFVACLGGGHFVVLITGIGSGRVASAAADDIESALRQSFLASGQRVYPSASIGIAIAPNDGAEVAEMLAAAAEAMDLAKSDGGNQVRFFNAGMHDIAVERVQLESELRSAIHRGQLRVFFQPVVDIASGSIVCAEALVRWQHPHRGLVGPDQFIPIAEQTGLIVPLGSKVLETVALQLSEWRCRDITLPVAVNVSVREFQEPAFLSRLTDLLSRYKLEPQLLTIEITESLAIDESEHIQQTLRACRDLGVNISLDDFGTSHACLANTKRLPITGLKIDKAFVRELPENRADVAIATAIVAFSQSLGLVTVAEGVETAEQARWLRDAGCTFGQGYYFGHPMPVEAFESQLWRDRRRQTA